MITQKRVHILHFFFTIIFTTLLSSGCSDIQSIFQLTPEHSAVLHVKELNQANFTIDTNSVEAIQKVELNNYILVLVQYTGTRLGNGVETCQIVLETKKDPIIHWNTGSGLCHEVNDPTETQPITVGSTRSGSTPQDPGYMTVYGMVRNPQITKIVITWEDEQSQSLGIQEIAYMAAREGEVDMKKVEAFNDQNELVYTTERQG